MKSRLRVAAVMMLLTGGYVAATDFKVGDCAVVLPSAKALPSPRGDFFIGELGQVTQFMLWGEPQSLRVAKRKLAVILHFQREPKDWEGVGEGFEEKHLRLVNCPKNFTLSPYGFDPQVLVDALKIIEKLQQLP